MVARLLLVLTTALAEALPLALLAALVDAWDTAASDTPLSPAALALAILVAVALTRALLRRGAPERVGRVVTALAALVVALPLAFGPVVSSPGPHGVSAGPVVAVAALLYAWSRGVALARDGLEFSPFDAIYASFRRGLVTLFGVLLLAAVSGGPAAHAVIDGGWGSVVLFFLAGLCALSIARVEGERRRAAGGAEAPALGGAWLPALFGVVAGVLLVGSAIALLASPALFAGALAALSHAADAVLLLLTPLVILASLLIEPIVDLLRLLVGHGRHPASQGARPPAARPPLPALTRTYANPAVEHAALAGVLLIVAVVALWYAFVVRRPYRSGRDGREERESLWSWALLLRGLSALLRRLRDRVGDGRTGGGAPWPHGAAGPGGKNSIRALYWRLLIGAARAGLARGGAETPHEYLERLRRAPLDDDAAATLTAAYVRVRYGDEREDAARTEAARRAWERLERALAEAPPANEPR